MTIKVEGSAASCAAAAEVLLGQMAAMTLAVWNAMTAARTRPDLFAFVIMSSASPSQRYRFSPYQGRMRWVSGRRIIVFVMEDVRDPDRL